MRGNDMKQNIGMMLVVLDTGLVLKVLVSLIVLL